MAELNTIKTRIISKHADLATLNASTTFKPYEGEIVLAKVTTYDREGVAVPAYCMKVGNGTSLFKDLNWVGAQSLDVYNWAKQEKLAVTRSGDGNVITNIIATATGITLETASVATSEQLTAQQEALTALTGRVTTAEGKITTLEGKMTAVEGAVATKAEAADVAEDISNLDTAYKAADAKLAEDIVAAESAAKSHAETKATAAQTAAEKHADDLNTAMDARVDVLEAIDHNAYIAADTALKGDLEGKITAEVQAREAADSSTLSSAQGYADTKKTEVIGASGDAASANTIYGAKKYADEKSAAAQTAGVNAAATAKSEAIADAKAKVDAESEARIAADNALDGRIDTLETTIKALEGTTHFIGVKDTLPTSSTNGDVCIVGNKEYIYSDGWVELGDTTAEAEAIQDNADAIDALSDRVGANESAIASLNTTVAGKADDDHKHVMADITDLATRLSGIDTEVNNAKTAAADALTDGKAYTDEQVAAARNALQGNINTVSGNVTTLTGRVDTAEDDIDAVEGRMTTAEGKITALETASEKHATKDELSAAQTAAATDATTKANAAQSAAISAAAADATSKANAAQAAAEATAATALAEAVDALETADESLGARVDTIEANYLEVKDGVVYLNDQVIVFDCGGIE